uniref:Mitochondrial pyruvate carrier n=1 Tax=Angiostrongylus cantonensis TaxID=6313 RepID=A0A0K0D8D4_ANGCA
MLSRVRNLSLRCQSTLLYHLYNLRSQNAVKSYNMLAQMDAQIQEEQQQQNGSAANNTSPGSSVHSNSNQSTTVVTMPSKVYDLQRQQLKTLHHLMWSHRVWQDAAKRADISNTDLAFIAGYATCFYFFDNNFECVVFLH